ncbi:MAG: hypothetical protein GX442_21055 [Candidatus Riflebacteria bacterium]|nr:hypothetical protein [Candidatus Riflebacteria bacterium]
MKTLIMKELREHALHLGLFIAAGVASVLMLAWFNQFDHETVLTLLFLFEAPLFTIMLGGHLVGAEVRTNTFPFLAALPLSRSAIWWGKAVAGLAICLTVYAAFAGLAWTAGIPELLLDFGMGNQTGGAEPWFQLRGYPFLTAGILLFGLPMALFAAAYWGTMLPNGLPVLETLVAVVALWLLWSGQALSALHLPLALGLLTIVFLASSWLTFRRGELMTGWRRAWWAIGSLAVGLGCAGLLWGALDGLADRRLPKGEMKELRVTDDGTSVLCAVETQAEWFDPLQGMGLRPWSTTDPDRTAHSRLLRLDPATGRFHQVGRRGLVCPEPSPDGKTLAAVALTSWPGLRTTPRLVLADPVTGDIRRVIDTNASPKGFLPDGRLLYERYVPGGGDLITTELCVYEPGSGSRGLFAIQQDRGGGLFPLALTCLDAVMVYTPDRAEPLLVALSTGRTASLPLPVFLHSPYQDEKLAILTAYNQPFHLVRPGAAPRVLTGLATDTEFLGRLPDGRLLVVMNATTTVDGFDLEGRVLGTFDADAGTCRPLAAFRNLRLNAMNTSLSGDGRTLLASMNSPGPGEAFLLDLETGRRQTVNLPTRSIRHLQPAGRRAFAVSFYEDLWRVDADTGAATRLVAVPSPF